MTRRASGLGYPCETRQGGPTIPATQSFAPETVGPRTYAHAFNRAEIYRLAGALTRLPRPVRLELSRRVGRLAARFLPAERAAVRRTLAAATGATERTLDALVPEVFGEFAMCFSDLLSAGRGRLAQDACIGPLRGVEHLDGVDGGMISLTAHVGNWDLAGRLLARRSARPTHVVVAVEEARGLEAWLRRDGEGVRFVSRAHPTVSLTLLAALRRGEVVALQGDRALGNRGDALVPFFGRPAPFPLGPFRLASATGVAIVPAFCTLDADRRYAIAVLEPFTVARGDEEAAAQRWVAALEERVRERPTQWFNFFDIWRPYGV